jgi:HD superfamily phosphohydrolase YqeK
LFQVLYLLEVLLEQVEQEERVEQVAVELVEIILLQHREGQLALMEDYATQIELAEILKLVQEVKVDEEETVEMVELVSQELQVSLPTW